MANITDKNDLTFGPITAKLIRFFLPIAAGTLLQQFYNAVDTLVVSKYVGTVAVAAVGGSAAQVFNLLINFFVAITSGATVSISHFFGAKDMDRVSKAVHTAVAFCLVAGFAISGLIVALAPQILTLLNNPVESFDYAVQYLRIVGISAMFALLFNMGSSVLRAMGDSKTPFIFLCVSCGLNIFMDLLFVCAFKWEVKGVAWATTIAQVICCVAIFVVLCCSKEAYRVVVKKIRFHGSILKRMLKIGVPAALQTSMYGVSNMIIQVAVNGLSVIAVAAWSLSTKIDGTYWALANAAGAAVTTFVGQNYGAGNIDRVTETTKKSLKMFMGVTIVMSVLLCTLSRPLLHVFTSDAEAITATMSVIYRCCPYYLTWTCIEILSAVMRGTGEARNPVIITGLGICLLRVVLIFTAFQHWHTLNMLSTLYPISWAVTTIAMAIYFQKGSLYTKVLKEYKAKQISNEVKA